MKKFIGLVIGVFVLIGFVSLAEAITINVAEVQNGLAVVQGAKAAKSATVTWDGVSVTQTSKGGSFSFSATVPADCVGTLSDGVSTIDVTLLDCTPVSKAPVPLARTGQTTSYAAGDDGALQKGVAWPNPRFSDNNNGTITDNLTGLIWLKDASCLGNPALNWFTALAAANTLADGNVACRLTDGSVAGDWRLPNRNELWSLMNAEAAGYSLPEGHPFVNFDSLYFSSTTDANSPIARVWLVDFNEGKVAIGLKSSANWAIAVRGGL
jgi:hypothetical protein